MHRDRAPVTVLAVALALAAAIVSIGAIAGLDPVVTARLSFVAPVAVIGWLPLDTAEGAGHEATRGPDSPDEHECECCALPAKAAARAHAAARSRSSQAG